jgi:hypothetical protein
MMPRAIQPTDRSAARSRREDSPASRYRNELLNRLDRVYTVGCAEIHIAELMLWSGGKVRFTSTIWREIADLWYEQYESPLMVGEAHGIFVFVWGEGLTASEDSWLKEIRDMSGQKDE